MKSIIWTLIFTMILISFSCNQQNSEQSMSYAKEMPVEEASEDMGNDIASANPTTPVVIDRKLIKNGDLTFETDDMDASRSQILGAIKKYQGYISNEREYKNEHQISNTIEVRLPSKSFDLFMTDATKGVELFDEKSFRVEDVTEEFVDIETRLKTKKELENKYLTLLKQAKSVKDILDIETQLGTLREEIESIEGRLNYLKNQVSFSTLNITFYKSIPIQSAFGTKFKNGFINGWDNLILFFVGLVNIWPFLLIFAGLVYAFFKYRRTRKAKKEQETTK